MSDLRLYLLGPLRIEIDRKPVDLPRRKTQAVLAYLALAAGPVRREVLAGLFWPDSAQTQAFAYLRHTLWEIGQALGPGRLISSREETALAPTWVDAQRFTRLLAEWKSTPDRPEGAALEEAVGLYQGDLLARFSLPDCAEFETWLEGQQSALRRDFEQALQALSSACEARGDLDQAAIHARRLISLDPLNEESHRALIGLYARAGRRSAALRAYREAERVLRDELGVEPEPETRALVEQTLAGPRPQPAPPAPPPAAPLSRFAGANLPPQSTPFIGRTMELGEIAYRLADPACRLLTLVGPGGIGKSRLSIQSAAGLTGQFSHGVCFVALAPLHTPDQVIPALAQALGLDMSLASSAYTQVEDYLRAREMLLVLDNMEHLLPAAETLSRLLAAAPGVKMLVTSRQGLTLPEEWVFELGGMSFPSGGSFADAQNYSALALLAATARRVKGGFELTRENLPDAVRICRLVDGIPLGIELAAAWVRILSLREIADEIERSLDILTTQMRTVPERQRSIRAAFESSWNRLVEKDRAAFCSLAVFHGGFTRAAAAQIVGIDLTGLSTLVDQSLVRHAPDGRYDLHELMRKFASEKLDERPDLREAMQTAHRRYYLEELIHMEEPIKGPQQVRVVQSSLKEMENFNAAWSNALQSHDLNAMVRAGPMVFLLFTRQLRMAEAIALLQPTIAWLEETQKEKPDDAQGKLLLGALYCAFSSLTYGQYSTQQVIDFLQRGLGLLEGLPASKLKSFAYLVSNFGRLTLDPVRMEKLFNETYTETQRAGDEWMLALCEMVYGGVVNSTGTGRNLGLLHSALARFERLNDPWGMGLVLNMLSGLHFWDADYPTAKTYAAGALERFREVGERMRITEAQFNLGLIAMSLGEYDEAIRLYSDNLTALVDLGSRATIAAHENSIGYVLFLQGRLAEAEAYYLRARDRYAETDDVNGQAMALNNLGDLERARGNFDGARQLYAGGLALLNPELDHWLVCVCEKNLGKILVDLDRLAEAEEHLARALETAVHIQRTSELPDIFTARARLLARQGQAERAVEMLALSAAHPTTTRVIREEALAVLEELRSALPPETYEAARRRGAALPITAFT